MTDIKILGGKVAKRALPLIKPPAGQGTPALKRLALAQGELAQFYDGEEGIRYAAFIEFLAGTPRGNHYHKIKEEFIYIIRGEVLLHVEDIASKEKKFLPLTPGDLVKISTGIAHALEIAEPGFAIEFSTSRFDPADNYRYALV